MKYLSIPYNYYEVTDFCYKSHFEGAFTFENLILLVEWKITLKEVRKQWRLNLETGKIGLHSMVRLYIISVVPTMHVFENSNFEKTMFFTNDKCFRLKYSLQISTFKL